MCMGMDSQWDRESHGNPMGMGKNTELEMGMDGNGKPSQWEWELPALPWEFIPKVFILR